MAKKWLKLALDQQVHIVDRINRDGALALFVGAGISVGSGLPDWNELTKRIASLTWRGKKQPYLDLVTNRGNPIAARMAKKKLEARFNGVVAQALYQDLVTPSQAVRMIAKSGISRICCFNFDDILEEAMRAEGLQHTAIVKGSTFQAHHDATLIFYPHGLIERFGSDDYLEGREIILSEDDYHGMYSEPYSWANLIQVYLLMHYNVLFVGMSLSDPNTRRLIDLVRGVGVRNQHFIILLDPRLAATATGEDSISKEEKTFREEELISLGIYPLWIRDFDEIPGIFKRIRRQTKSPPQSK